jgi:ferrous iron transport protein B
VVNICEVNNLARNLYLFLQLKELGAPVLLAVNMTDELKRTGRTIDFDCLSREFGVPVIPVSAKYNRDTDKLLARAVALADGAAGGAAARTARAAEWRCKYDYDGADGIERARYDYIDRVTARAVAHSARIKRGKACTPSKFPRSSIDKVMLNKYLALPLFVLVMAAVFYLTFGLLGKYMTLGVKAAIDLIGDGASRALIRLNAPMWIKGLLTEGVIGGAGTVVTFLPQITLLFLFLAFLEDTGYLSRVAFMTDGIFRKVGLSGRSAFTLLMGFGCSTSAVMTARHSESEALRRKTVLLTPFMSCSARLPVYSVIAAAFFLNQWLLIFGLYALGVAAALLLSLIFERFPALRSGEPSFIMEMPPYRLPSAGRVGTIIWRNIKVFLTRVATVILGLSVIIWILSNFSFGFAFIPDTPGAHSMMELIAGGIAWIFLPLGFGNWRAATALLSGFIAKESVISTLQALVGEGGALTAVLDGGVMSALSFTVFVLLYVPCISASGAIGKELGTRWMWFSIALQTAVAYTASFVVYWTGTLLLRGSPALLGGVACAAVTAVLTVRLRKGRRIRGLTGGGCMNCPAPCGRTARAEGGKGRI